MSEAGKLRRGKILYSYRDLNGNLPKEITKDNHKMEEVTFYLNSIKPKSKPKEVK